MEVDSLRSMLINASSTVDYTSKSMAADTADKGDSNKTHQTVAERVENSKNSQNAQGAQGAQKAQGVNDPHGKKAAEAEEVKENNTHEKISNEFFDKFIEESNKKIFASNREFNYTMHDATNRVAIKVLDRNTKEIIREIPPMEKLDAAAKMMELVGIIIDKKI